ncbi:MAG: single-stranded-DNA-specific exonuclease RecJ [Oscillospiraceae bacterium]|nr:single-stranded-DNA-specific exonuclease RecJ [Oscillospiraceae bacterium]
MKYGIWNVARYDEAGHRALCEAGYSPLTAAVLCSRGCRDSASAHAYLAKDAAPHDPFLLKDMDRAVTRVRAALSRGEKIAVFGDYDVDGITATCLLTEFLREAGGDVTPYIPGRIEEGYGLNETALRALSQQGVKLIVSVDCGITADEEALLCRELGIDLVITDHHECKDTLPEAAAVVDPHRKDCAYPNEQLAGVAVAFKLAAALDGDQMRVLARCCDLVCLGTVADVMPLQGENRTFVVRGLQALTERPRVGIRALMEECGCADQPVTASLIGYTLAPRINAAGRMAEVEVAVELFLTHDRERAAELARQLCRMNRHRQAVETEIYQDAVSMLDPNDPDPGAIVLAGENWHQGVVGIVASRLSEEFCCPTFLICMDGDKGKASSRSYGGYNLFGALERFSDLLESYGGHELAAGFTIRRDRIDAFREAVRADALAFRESDACRQALEIDCEVPPELLTIENVAALEQLEPCGVGCPRPVFCMRGVTVEQTTPVGGGKHLRLRLRKGEARYSAIFFSTTALGADVCDGDYVEVAFQAQINEFRGTQSVQLNLVDVRQNEKFRLIHDEDRAKYRAIRAKCVPNAATAAYAKPDRREFVMLWKYLTANAEDGVIEDTFAGLARKSTRAANLPCAPLRLRICIDVMEELGLIRVTQTPKTLRITLTPPGQKVDLNSSRILAWLSDAEAGTADG